MSIDANPGHGHLEREFSLLGVISVAWNTVNLFGGLSYIFVVGFSDGGLPAIVYGLCVKPLLLPHCHADTFL